MAPLLYLLPPSRIRKDLADRVDVKDEANGGRNERNDETFDFCSFIHCIHDFTSTTKTFVRQTRIYEVLLELYYRYSSTSTRYSTGRVLIQRATVLYIYRSILILLRICM